MLKSVSIPRSSSMEIRKMSNRNWLISISATSRREMAGESLSKRWQSRLSGTDRTLKMHSSRAKIVWNLWNEESCIEVWLELRELPQHKHKASPQESVKSLWRKNTRLEGFADRVSVHSAKPKTLLLTWLPITLQLRSRKSGHQITLQNLHSENLRLKSSTQRKLSKLSSASPPSLASFKWSQRQYHATTCNRLKPP